MNSNRQTTSTLFSSRLVNAQDDLLVFVTALMPFERDEIADVVQETNQALLEHADEYDPEKPFLPWMRAFAKRQVAAFHQRRKQQKFTLDNETVERCADMADEEEAFSEPMLKRLAVCKRKLTPRQNKLLGLRYDQNLSATEIATKFHNTCESIYADLTYIRKKLADCIRRFCRMSDEQFERENPDFFGTTLARLLDDSIEPKNPAEFLRSIGADSGHLRRYYDQITVHALLQKNARTYVRPAAFPLRWKIVAAAAFAAILAGGTVVLCRKEAIPPLGQRTAAGTGEAAAIERVEATAVNASRPESAGIGQEGTSAFDSHRPQSIAIEQEPLQPLAPEGALQKQTAKEKQTMKSMAAGMARMGTAAAALTIAAGNTVGVLPAEAVDYTWLASPFSANWNTSDVNWDCGLWTNSPVNVVTFGASDKTAITVDGEKDAAAISVSGADYSFTGGQLNLNGAFTVGNGGTVDLYSALAQTNPASASCFSKAGDGALVLHGGADKTNTLYRLRQDAGTLALDGGTLYINGSSASTDAPLMTGYFTGGTTLIGNGAKLAFTNTSYLSNSGGAILVTNGTLDISGAQFMNGGLSSGGPQSVLTVQDGGVITADVIRISQDSRSGAENRVAINVNSGGVLQLKNFKMEESSGSAYRGSVNLNGGLLDIEKTGASPHNLFCSSANKTSWQNVHPRVLEGGCYLKNGGDLLWLYKSIESGAAQDGGLHLTGSSVTYLWVTNNYNGGTHFTSGGSLILAILYDGSLGAVPPEPTNNIFFFSSSSTLHAGGSLELNANRTIFIASNCVASIGTQNTCVMKIRGTIQGEGGPTNYDTAVSVANTWYGNTVLDPGEGRTNSFSRLRDYGVLEIASGTTLLRGSKTGTSVTDGNAMLYVSGRDNAYGSFGQLTVSGGEIINGKIDTRTAYFEVNNYGQIFITGGLVDSRGNEYLNGLETPGQTTVSGSGVLDVGNLRVTQSSVLPRETTAVNACTGGVIRLYKFTVDESVNCPRTKHRGVVNLNGGLLFAKQYAPNFMGSDDLTWRTNIFFYVREGGAKIQIDASNTAACVKNSLYSGAEQDGGLTKLGGGQLQLFNTNTYNGITTVLAGRLNLRYPLNTLPISNTVAICAGASCDLYRGERIASATQTLARVEGAGAFNSNSQLTVIDSLAPGDGTNGIGTLTFEQACSLGGTLEIDGNTSNADCVAVNSGVQDISALSVKVSDFKALSKDKVYTIFTSKDGYTGKFASLNTGKISSWLLRYDKDGKNVYLAYRKGTVVMLM